MGLLRLQYNLQDIHWTQSSPNLRLSKLKIITGRFLLTDNNSKHEAICFKCGPGIRLLGSKIKTNTLLLSYRATCKFGEKILQSFAKLLTHDDKCHCEFFSYVIQNSVGFINFNSMNKEKLPHLLILFP